MFQGQVISSQWHGGGSCIVHGPNIQDIRASARAIGTAAPYAISCCTRSSKASANRPPAPGYNPFLPHPAGGRKATTVQSHFPEPV